MSTAQGFYVHLRSRASTADYPKNSELDFTNLLCSPITLHPDLKWLVGVCEVHLPLLDKNELAERFYKDALKYRQQANEAVEFGHELVRDAEFIEHNARIDMKNAERIKSEAEKAMEENTRLRADLDKERKEVEQQKQFLDLLAGEHEQKSQQQSRSAADLDERQASMREERDKLEKMKDEHKAKERAIDKTRAETETERRALASERSDLETLRKSLEKRETDLLNKSKILEQAKVELTQARQQLDELANQQAQEKLTLDSRIAQVKAKEEKLAAATPKLMNRLLDPYGKSHHDFPVKTYKSVNELLHSIFTAMPRIFQSILASHIVAAAETVGDSLVGRGTNPRYRWCGYYNSPVNKIEGYDQYGICFPPKTFTSAQDLVNDILYLGCYTKETAKRLAYDIIDECEARYFPQTLIAASSEFSLYLPHKIYTDADSIHTQIQKRANTPAQREAYARALVQAVNEDEILPAVSRIDPRSQGLIFHINIRRSSSVEVPVLQYPSMKAFIMQLRAGTHDQQGLTNFLHRWRTLAYSLTQSAAGARRVRRTASDDECPAFPPNLIQLYCNLVCLQHQGGKMHRVLRMLPYPIEKSNGHIVFNPVYYLPLRTHWFNTIRIAIFTAEGERLPQQSCDSECFVTLHFRPE